MYALFCLGHPTVWIVGDSIVRRSRQPLDVPGRIYWKGKGGAGVCDLPDLLHSMRAPQPKIIMIHIGTNDLGCTDMFSIRQRIAYYIDLCRRSYPSATLVWSAILPRLFYYGAKDQGSMEHIRRSINRWARSRCRLFGASFLPHDLFHWQNHALYLYDGVHLSVTGTKLLLSDFASCIAAHCAT